MTDHFQRIYATEADRYHRLINAEDAFGELERRVADIAAAGSRFVDVGTGTGRLALQLCQAGKRVHGVDIAADMLRVAGEKLSDTPGDWMLSRADARQLPVADNWADAALAGWVFGHFTEFNPDGWRDDLRAALSEMDRVVRPGGTQVIIDTLGTATAQPGAPTAALADYHELVEEMGFDCTVLQTNYRFASVAESVELLEWFFGLGDWARRHDDPEVPEFTGWWELRA